MKNNQVYFKDIRNKIIEQIQLANSEILIAVAWLTDENIISALEEVAKRNIKIKIVFYDDKINRKDLFKDLFLLKAEIKFTPKLMHNKFCIIDKSVVINGSYNWTYSARTNHENITINYGVDNLTHEFITEFNNIFHSATKIDQYFKSIDSQFEEYLQAQTFPVIFPVFICYDNTYKIIQELFFVKKQGFYFILIKDETDFTTYHHYIFNRSYHSKKHEFARLGLQIYNEIYDYSSTKDDLIKWRPANSIYFHNSNVKEYELFRDKSLLKVSNNFYGEIKRKTLEETYILLFNNKDKLPQNINSMEDLKRYVRSLIEKGSYKVDKNIIEEIIILKIYYNLPINFFYTLDGLGYINNNTIKKNQFLYFTNKKCLVTQRLSDISQESKLFFIDQAGNIISQSQNFRRFSLYPEIISIDYSRNGVIYDKDLNEIDLDNKKITLIRDKWIYSNEFFSSSNQSYLFYGLLDTKFRVLLPNIFHKLIEERNDKIIFESHPLYAKYNKIKTLENPINTPAEKRLFNAHLEVLALRFEYNFLTKKLTQVTFNPLSKNYYYLTDDNGIYADFYKLRLSNLKISEVEEMKNYFFVNKLLNNKKELEKHFNAKIQSIQQKDQNNSQNCYIATLAYQNIEHPQVEYLRKFRDNRLMKIYLGKVFIKLYYRFSPSLVNLLGNKPTINYLLRTLLNYLIKFLKIFYVKNSL